MTSVIAEAWPGAPLEICRHVQSFINVLPSACKEFQIPQDVNHIGLLNGGAFVLGTYKYFRCDRFDNFTVVGDGYDVPDGCVLMSIDGGRLFLFNKDTRTMHIVEQNKKTVDIHVDYDVWHIWQRPNRRVLYMMACDDNDRELEVDLPYDAIDDDDARAFSPWISSYRRDNKIAYITTKEIDGVPQKIAVLAEL